MAVPRKPPKPTGARGLSAEESRKLDELMDTGPMKQARVKARMAEKERMRKPKAPPMRVPEGQGLKSQRSLREQLYKEFSK